MGIHCGTVFNDLGLPLFFITDDEELEDEPLFVFDYHQIQQLLGFITDYLILADEYYEDVDDEH